MSNLSHKNISSILNSKLQSFSKSTGYDVAWEDIPYDPTVGTTYLEQFYLPGEGEEFRSGDKEQGIYQVNVNVELGDGRGVALDIIDSMRTFFGRSIVVAGKGRVGITKSFLSVPQRDESWYTEILNFRWEAM